MRGRCENPNNASFKNYGGRGIEVDPRWLDFEAFRSDMGDPPAGHTLERLDVNGNYSKANCIWATPKQQARNTRRNIIVEIDGIRACLSDHAERAGLPYKQVWARINRCGWSAERALSEPIGAAFGGPGSVARATPNPTRRP